LDRVKLHIGNVAGEISYAAWPRMTMPRFFDDGMAGGSRCTALPLVGIRRSPATLLHRSNTIGLLKNRILPLCENQPAMVFVSNYTPGRYNG